MRRIFAALLPGLVALALIAQVSQAAHMVLVEHTLCAEHGQLVHEGHHAASGASGAPDSVSAAAHDGEGGHEHCLVQLNAKTRIAPPVSTANVCTALPLPAATIALARAHVTVDILRTAPKSSPPA